MKRLIAGVVLLVVAATAWAATSYTFSGTSFPTCSSGAWSGTGTAANPYTCSSGSFSLNSGDSILPSSAITIMANAGISLAGNNAIGSSSVSVNLQSTYGNITVGSGSTIYGSLTSSSGSISLTSTAVYGSISTNSTVTLSGGSVSGSVTGSGGVTTTNGTTIGGSVTSSSGSISLSGGSVTGNVNGSNGVTTTNGTTIGGSVTSSNGSISLSGGSVTGNVNGSNGVTTTNGTTVSGSVTANGGPISLSGGSVTGAVHSDCCKVTTNNTNLAGGVSSNSNTVNITGGSISGTISTSGGNGISITGATLTSGSVVTTSVPITITNSTINGNVTGNNTVTLVNSVVNGNVTAGSWNGALVTDSNTFVNGVCSSNTNSIASPSDPQYTQCTGGVNNPGISAFNAFEFSTTAVTGNIYTKLAGTGFKLSVVATSGGAVVTSWSGTVSVSLVANTGSTPGHASCPAGYNTASPLATVSVAITNGRGTATFDAISTAYRDVRAYIVSTSLAVSACSSDLFAIRPTTLAVKAPLSSSTALNNATATGTPAIKAGSNFTLTASAAGYLGTPTITMTSITVPSASWTKGTLASSNSGFDTAASGSNSNTASGTFTYSEVGNFGLSADAVYDSAFTSVDQAGDCVSGSTSNTLSSGGQYGCNIGSATQTGIGRFFPDHFQVAVTAGCSATGKTAYTYSGQPLNKVVITAQNASSGTTKNYDTGLGFSKAVTLTDVSGASGTWSNNGVNASMFLAGVTSSNSATMVTPTFTFSAPAPSPSIPKTLQVRATENSGGDGVSSQVSSSVNYDDSALVRFGRLRLFNAYGAVGTTLNLPVQAQYWSADGVWVQNSDDSCSTLAPGNVYLAAGTVAVKSGTGTLTMSGGATTLPLTTSSISTISSNVAINLGATGSAVTQSCLSNGSATAANEPWLRSLNGSCVATYDRDPAATATFGIYTPESKRMVHAREAFW